MTATKHPRSRAGATAGGHSQTTTSSPRTRRNQPGTSLEAWETGLPDLGHVQAAVLALLTERAMNLDELYAAYVGGGYPMKSRQRVSTARAELAKLGFVRNTGETRPSNFGNRSYVWEATPLAELPRPVELDAPAEGVTGE